MSDKKDKRGIVMGRQCRFTVENPDLKDRPGPGTYSIGRPSSTTVSFTNAPRMSHQTSSDLIGRKSFLITAGQYEIKSEFERKDRGFTLTYKAK